MRRPLALAFLAASLGVALAGCPLPQPLAEVGRVDGGSVTTPIILPHTAAPPDTIVFVARGCSVHPLFALSVTVEDADTTEVVEARWFVDYDPADGPASTPQATELPVPPSPDPADPTRPLAPYTFDPYRYQVDVPLHVVDVVVSNGFLLQNDPTAPPNRAPIPGFITQSFRWVFQFVDPGDPRGRCG